MNTTNDNTTRRLRYMAPRTSAISMAAPMMLPASGGDPEPADPEVYDDVWADDSEML